MPDPQEHASTPSPADGVDPFVATAHPVGGDPRPDLVATELDRIVRRMRELPVARAEATEPVVRAAFADLLVPGMPQPAALGVATSVEQLRVLVYDACVRARAGSSTVELAGVEDVLVQLRRALP